MRTNDKNKVHSKYYLFIIAVLIVKVILMGLFSSDYQNKLFIPFVKDFVLTGGNVYQRFYEKGIINAFPYPPVMLFVESAGMFIIKTLGIKNVFMINFCFKLPSCLLDLIGLKILVRFFPEKEDILGFFIMVHLLYCILFICMDNWILYLWSF